MLSDDETTAGSHPPIMNHRRPGPEYPAYGIPADLWPTVMQRVLEQKEPLRTLEASYGVSDETIRRILLHVQKQRGQQESYLCNDCHTAEALCATGLIGTEPA